MKGFWRWPTRQFFAAAEPSGSPRRRSASTSPIWRTLSECACFNAAPLDAPDRGGQHLSGALPSDPGGHRRDGACGRGAPRRAARPAHGGGTDLARELPSGPAISDYTALFPEVQVRLTLNDRAEDPIRNARCGGPHRETGVLDLIARASPRSDWSLAPRRCTWSASGYTSPRPPRGHHCLIDTGGPTPGEWRFRGPDGEYGFQCSATSRPMWARRCAWRIARARPHAARRLCGPTRHRRRRLCAVLPDHEAKRSRSTPSTLIAAYRLGRTLSSFWSAVAGGAGRYLKSAHSGAPRRHPVRPVHGRRAEAVSAGEEAPQAYRQLVPCT